jgi:hypothetical protein
MRGTPEERFAKRRASRYQTAQYRRTGLGIGAWRAARTRAECAKVLVERRHKHGQITDEEAHLILETINVVLGMPCPSHTNGDHVD